jgi:predicted dehydrogenase
MTTLRVLIIGCGNIAGGFDANRPCDGPPLTHAGAFLRHGGYALAACMDPDESRRSAFQERWNVAQGFASVDVVENRVGDYDVVSICSPTALHAKHLQLALALRPKLVFCEKPVTTSLAQTATWVERYDAAGVQLAVNHTRRWAPDVMRLRDELNEGAWGSVRSAVGVYGKGILNNGGHILDLLLCLLGPLSLLTVGRPIWDHWDDDPTIPALLVTAKGASVELSVSDARDFSFFELQIVTERGVIAMENGGLEWRIRRVINSPHFAGYRSLDAGESVPGEYAHAMSNAVDNIYNSVANREVLSSSGHSAMEAQRLCEQIKSAASERC